MIQLCDNSICTGCMACYASCNQQAIEIQENNFGFLQPSIKHDVCIECGICVKTCPVLSPSPFQKEKQKGFASWSTNENIRKNSSSGGVFYELSHTIITSGGVVCGAAFNEKMEVEHRIISNLNELPLLMGSKYVQSNILPVLKEVKSILTSTSHKVLFSGTPCQIAGLLNYLHKRYDNLITIDIVCHGVPSPGLWHKYIRYQKNKSKF